MEYSLMWAIFLAIKSQMKNSLTFIWVIDEKAKITAAHKKTGSHLPMAESSFVFTLFLLWISQNPMIPKVKAD